MITHTLHQMEKDTVASMKWGGGMSIVVAQTETKELRIVRRNVTRIQAVKVIRSVPLSPDVIFTPLLLVHQIA